jgi:flap endonuclease-1
MLQFIYVSESWRIDRAKRDKQPEPNNVASPMGVNLTPIIRKEKSSLNGLRGRTLAVDASVTLYQFLSVIRLDYGVPLQDSRGRPTSHLTGLLYRATRLICDYDIRLVFVFDAAPPLLKQEELRRRSLIRLEAQRQWEDAVAQGDREKAFSKAVTSTRLTRPMIEEAKRLLQYLGIPQLQAPSEAEAQAAHMCQMGRVWAANTQDYDCLLYGAPRLTRYVTIAGTEYLPSKRAARKLVPEIIHLDRTLNSLGIGRDQLIDLAILIGTDYNRGIKGIGPKTALKLVKQYGTIECLPTELRAQVTENYGDIRRLFKEPEVTDNYTTNYGSLDEEGLRQFLVQERGFSLQRVEAVIERMRKFYSTRTQTGLGQWFGEDST